MMTAASTLAMISFIIPLIRETLRDAVPSLAFKGARLVACAAKISSSRRPRPLDRLSSLSSQGALVKVPLG